MARLKILLDRLHLGQIGLARLVLVLLGRLPVEGPMNN